MDVDQQTQGSLVTLRKGTLPESTSPPAAGRRGRSGTRDQTGLQASDEVPGQVRLDLLAAGRGTERGVYTFHSRHPHDTVPGGLPGPRNVGRHELAHVT